MTEQEHLQTAKDAEFRYSLNGMENLSRCAMSIRELLLENAALKKDKETMVTALTRAREMMFVMNGASYPLPIQTRKYEVFKLVDSAIAQTQPKDKE